MRKIVIPLVILTGLAVYIGLNPPGTSQNSNIQKSQQVAFGEKKEHPGNSKIGRAFRQRKSDVWVSGGGKVIRILPDDNKGSRHQKFIVKLVSGQTLLISHNIDLAPRIEDLKVNDTVEFHGEYIWNSKGGIIHWTHHDPKGKLKGGWVKCKGNRYF